MSGSGSVRFSDLFVDTFKAHGFAFCYEHYVQKHGMPEWEYEFWCRYAVCLNWIH